MRTCRYKSACKKPGSCCGGREALTPQTSVKSHDRINVHPTKVNCKNDVWKTIVLIEEGYSPGVMLNFGSISSRLGYNYHYATGYSIEKGDIRTGIGGKGIYSRSVNATSKKSRSQPQIKHLTLCENSIFTSWWFQPI